MFKVKRIVSLALLLVLLVSVLAVPASAASYTAVINRVVYDDREIDYRYASNFKVSVATLATKTIYVPRDIKYIGFCYEQGAPASQTFTYIDGIQNRGMGGWSITGTGKLTSYYLYRASDLDTSYTTTSS